MRILVNNIRRLDIWCALSGPALAAACSSAAVPSAPVAASPAAAAVALPPGGKEQAAVDQALELNPAPVAVVVLGLDGATRVLALGRHAGADPATQLAVPGSTLKPIVAWIAADAGVYHAGDRVTCDGSYTNHPSYHCFATHGPLDLVRAIEVSCNVYFMSYGERLGLERLSAGIRRFGLTAPTGLAPGEASGWVADPAWVSAHPEPREPWELAVGMGHGPLEVTLLELAAAYAKLAVLVQTPSATVSDATRAELEAGLRGVVTDPSGTGQRAAVRGLEIAGKTGTAEAKFGDHDDASVKENGWFVGYTPVKSPRRLVAVLVHHAGSGGETAAPIAARIFERIRDGSVAAPSQVF
jgi:penicillin-binding protein 2